jgi:hypothetical protein
LNNEIFLDTWKKALLWGTLIFETFSKRVQIIENYPYKALFYFSIKLFWFDQKDCLAIIFFNIKAYFLCGFE